MSIQKKMFLSLILLVAVFFLGTVGFMLSDPEVWNRSDAMFMTMITISSTGYEEVHTLNDVGRIVSCALQIFGVGFVAYFMSVFTVYLVEGVFRESIRRRKMLAKIQKLRDHYIICGLGETGMFALRELLATGHNVVIVDKNPERFDKLKEHQGVHFVEGDADEDDVLEKANIYKAQGLIASLPLDKDNLFVTITAKQLNPKLRIIARAAEETTVKKLQRSGADSVVSPNRIGGMRMASELVRPSVVDFLDSMLRDTKVIRVEEVVVSPDSNLVGHSLGEAEINRQTGALIVAVKDPNTPDQKFIFNPTGDFVIKSGITLVVIGEVPNINKLRTLAGVATVRVPEANPH